MELSDNTVAILKNYASINPNIVVFEGNNLKTISVAKNVVSSTKIDNEFPKTFGIYDLDEFLRVLGLVDQPRLKFEEDYVLVADSAGRSRIKYFYAEREVLTTPTKEIIFPDPEVSFTMDSTTINRVRRAASALGHKEVSITSSGPNLISISVIDSSDKTSNVFSIDVDGSFSDKNFDFRVDIENLKMIDGDYTVELSSKQISHFVNKELPLEYWVALKPTSTYGA